MTSDSLVKTDITAHYLERVDDESLEKASSCFLFCVGFFFFLSKKTGTGCGLLSFNA